MASRRRASPARSRAPRPWILNGSVIRALHRQPGAQRGERVLEHRRDVPAIGRAPRPERALGLMPSKWMAPAAGLTRPMIARPSVDLPLPLSPTMPSVCPGARANDTRARRRRTDRACRRAAPPRAHRPIAHDQIVDPEQLSHGRADGSARRAFGRRRGKAAAASGSARTRTDSAGGTRSPRAVSARLGTSPAIVGSSRVACSMRAGSQRRSACV